MLTIKKRQDKRVVRAFTHKLADIPNGVTVSVSDFTQGTLHEGQAFGKNPETGLYHLIKAAVLTADVAAEATVLPVAKGHNFKVGDVVMLKKGSKAYTITSITTNANDNKVDDITVGTALGSGKKGDGLYQAKAEVATVSEFKYKPVGLAGESYDVNTDSNLSINLVTIGQVKEANIPALGAGLKAELPLINFI